MNKPIMVHALTVTALFFFFLTFRFINIGSNNQIKSPINIPSIIQ